MFYEVENKENMIAGGNWIRQYKKTLSRVWLSIAEIREKDHPYGCVHRYKRAEGTILVGEHYER